MSRKDINVRVFTHAGKKITEPEPLRACPFYNDSTGCQLELGCECNYNKGKSIPADCPMKSGSVTLIYYVEDL